MAGVERDWLMREQFAAILQMRWLTFLHARRTARGQLELATSIVAICIAALLGFGGAFGLGAGAYYFGAHQHWETIAFLLWPVMLFWQLIPVMSAGFSGCGDSTELIRFPLSLKSYFLIHLIEGLAGPVSLITCLWLLGIMCGMGLANPTMLPAAVILLAAFGVVNLLLSRMVLTWVERWMAQRRTRELLGGVVLLLLMSLQFLGPAMDRVGHRQRREVAAISSQFLAVQKALPPGAAAEALAGVAHRQIGKTVTYLSVLVAYCLGFLLLLGVRLSAQYRGESPGEFDGKRKTVPRERLKPGWNVFGWPGPVAAAFEKEVRYLLRSGQKLLGLLSPLFLVLMFSLQTGRGHTLIHITSMAFPACAAFALLSVSNLFQNSFGADGGGLQLLFALPVRFRDVMLGKNLAYTAVLAVELGMLGCVLSLMHRMPSFGFTMDIILAIGFALAVQASIGNLLSVYMPKKVDPSRFNRQQMSPAAAVINLGASAAIFGLSGLALFVAPRLWPAWITPLVLCALAGTALFIYVGILRKMDHIVQSRKEDLLQEVCRTT